MNLIKTIVHLLCAQPCDIDQPWQRVVQIILKVLVGYDSCCNSSIYISGCNA